MLVVKHAYKLHYVFSLNWTNSMQLLHLLSLHLSTEVPAQVKNITVNPDEKTITWAAPAEPNGIIVGYRVQYWELGRRDTAKEVNTTAVELKYSYSNFSKCSTTYCTHHNSNMAPSMNTIYIPSACKRIQNTL